MVHLIFPNGPNSPIGMTQSIFGFVLSSTSPVMRIGILILMVLGPATMASAESLGKHVPDAEIVGQAKFKVFLFKIYDAILYAPNGHYDPDGVFAIRLNYLVDVSKAQIIKSSLFEMERQTQADTAQLQVWKKFLDASFRDLKDGESATAIHNQDGSITFFFNGVEGETINDANFADAFMNIWLSDNARDPDFSRVLRGLDNQS